MMDAGEMEGIFIGVLVLIPSSYIAERTNIALELKGIPIKRSLSLPALNLAYSSSSMGMVPSSVLSFSSMGKISSLA